MLKSAHGSAQSAKEHRLSTMLSVNPARPRAAGMTVYHCSGAGMLKSAQLACQAFVVAAI